MRLTKDKKIEILREIRLAKVQPKDKALKFKIATTLKTYIDSHMKPFTKIINEAPQDFFIATTVFMYNLEKLLEKEYLLSSQKHKLLLTIGKKKHNMVLQ